MLEITFYGQTACSCEEGIYNLTDSLTGVTGCVLRILFCHIQYLIYCNFIAIAKVKQLQIQCGMKMCRKRKIFSCLHSLELCFTVPLNSSQLESILMAFWITITVTSCHLQLWRTTGRLALPHFLSVRSPSWCFSDKTSTFFLISGWITL